MQETTTIRITKELYYAIKTLSSQHHSSMQAVLEEAVEQYKRQKFFEEMNSAFARLKADEKVWKEELSERDEWSGLLLDGVEKDEVL